LAFTKIGLVGYVREAMVIRAANAVARGLSAFQCLRARFTGFAGLKFFEPPLPAVKRLGF
jgi:hypothetical protein